MKHCHQEEPQVLVERILTEAVDRKASDVYWLPCAQHVDVRFRIDGAQQNVAELPLDLGEKCITRIKVLAGLLTYRTKIAQDGAIKGVGGNAGTEMRASVMPTSHGERVSIRILRNAGGPLHLEELGFSDEATHALRVMLDQPTGMIVLTGPTGSGKTTTIYALIRELLRKHHDPASIITIEDPIECEIDGVSQTAVSQESAWGYASALRSALRQDVKTLVVGEMRDKEVVRVTLDAALTGHRVITTYHAGDIPSVYARMLHSGFEPFLVASAVTGVVSQRLVRRADGKGRVPCLAFLTPNDEWRDFITANPGLGELRKKIRQFPHADLSTIARRMAKEKIVSEQEYRLICSAE